MVTNRSSLNSIYKSCLWKNLDHEFQIWKNIKTENCETLIQWTFDFPFFLSMSKRNCFRRDCQNLIYLPEISKTKLNHKFLIARVNSQNRSTKLEFSFELTFTILTKQVVFNVIEIITFYHSRRLCVLQVWS